MPMYFCCVGVFACLVVHCVVCALVFGCVPVVAWLNSNDGSRHLFGSWCAWGVVEHVSRMFFGQPLLMTSSGWGLVVEPCNFWIFASPAPVWVLVGLFLVGFGLFTACFC